MNCFVLKLNHMQYACFCKSLKYQKELITMFKKILKKIFPSPFPSLHRLKQTNICNTKIIYESYL